MRVDGLVKRSITGKFGRRSPEIEFLLKMQSARSAAGITEGFESVKVTGSKIALRALLGSLDLDGVIE